MVRDTMVAIERVQELASRANLGDVFEVASTLSQVKEATETALDKVREEIQKGVERAHMDAA